MSLMLQYEQKKGTGQKRPGYAQLQKLFGPAYGLGSPGPNFCFSPQPPQPGETGEWVYMLYGREKPLGRGFCLHIQPDFSLFQMVTPLPTTGHDLDDFFAVAAKLGGYLGQADFLTEERQTFPVEGMEVFRDEMKGDNCLMVKDFADERPGFAVSGVLYPLHMGEVFCLRLAQMDPVAAEQAFSQCLGQKQTGGYYYLNPNFYRNTETGEAFAIYALSEGVASIIPKEPFIPYGEGPFGAEPVHTWKLALIQNGAETGVLATLPYADFLAALRAGEAQEFDEKHLLLKGLALPRLRQLALLGEVSGA